MSLATLTPAQRRWSDTFLGLIGLPATAPARNGPAGGDDARPHHYGEGYKPFDSRDVHPKLKAALDSGKMISAKDWTESAEPPDVVKQKNLLLAKETIKARLKGLGEARSKQLKLKAEFDKANKPLELFNECKGTLTGVKEGPPLYPFGSVGIPSGQFAAEIQAADAKYEAMLRAKWTLEDVKPPSEPQAKALDLAIAWKEYWTAIKNGLTKAQSDGAAGFDPDLVPKPAERPDFAALSSDVGVAKAQKTITEMTGKASPLAPATAPPSLIPKTDFATQIDAAKQKAAAMRSAAASLRSITQPSPKQGEALTRVLAREEYWKKVEAGLTKANQEGAEGFDPATVTKQAELPDLDGLSGSPRVSTAYAEIARMAGEDSPLAPAAVAPSAIPKTDFATQIDAAKQKAAAMRSAAASLRSITQPSPEQGKALTRVLAREEYWKRVEAGLTKANQEGAEGFDPATVTKQDELAESPDFTGLLGGPEVVMEFAKIAGKAGKDAPLEPATTKVQSTDFGDQLKAAGDKWWTMLSAQRALEKIVSPTGPQTKALELMKAWSDYWYKIKGELTKAQSRSATEFDPATVQKPADVPGDVRSYLAVAAKTGKDSPLAPATVPGPKIRKVDFDTKIASAAAKYEAMNAARTALDDLNPRAPEQEEALKSVVAWRDYWDKVQAGLTKARTEGAPDFDTSTVPTPAAPPADVQAHLAVAAKTGKDSPLARAAAPVAKVPKIAYDTQIEAADAKWSAMVSAEMTLEQVELPTEPHTKALELVKAWLSYWYEIKRGLTQAKSRDAVEFDPASVTAPDERPDLAGLEAAAMPDVKKAQKEVADHKKVALDPIEEDMRKCLPLLDAPQNNPERVEVGGALQALEAVDERIKKAIGSMTEKLAAEKALALAKLERTVFAWNDRRARQNLPPSAEAVAMADMLQAEHRTLIDHVVKAKLPLTVADSDDLDPEVEKALQKTWADLRDGTGTITVPDTFDPNSKVGGANKTAAEAEQFRSETLANFARLLGSEAGRHLVAELNRLGKGLTIQPSDVAGALPTAAVPGMSQPKLSPTDQEATTESEAKQRQGVGTGSTVSMVRGEKDSDVALCTEEGNHLFSPRFITLGHEMTHALHNARGINRTQIPLTEDKIWDNTEELQTIRNGQMSEQTLRAQFGLSAVRFGHKHIDAGQPVADAFQAALDTAEKVAGLGGPDNLAKQFERLNFTNPDRLTDATKVAILNASPPLKGPLPAGWDANQLNVEQMGVILAKQLPPRLKKLGWSPFDLGPPGSGDQIDEVVTTQRYHPRSPAGVWFRSLGGEEALKAIRNFELDTMIKVADWSEAKWASKLAALSGAESWLLTFCRAKGGEFLKIADEKGKLTTKLPKLAMMCKAPGDPSGKNTV